MKRAAIYARFSSDLQRDKSIDDQIEMCREIAAREGAAVELIFEDRAISGASTVNRPGFRDMMKAAEKGGFDILIAEDIDRISRDQADYHNARKRLDFCGVKIITASGTISKMDGALRALMGEMFLENLAIHTRRGLEGVIRDGRHAGGRAYGYRAVPGQPGELEIIADEAEIVRGIFADYVAGSTPRQIATRLNERRIKPPRGKSWNASTINGNAGRGGGILLNEIYVGRIVWNKVRMIKDPATGKRLSKPNPKEQHRVAAAEHLRIVADDVWQEAQERKTSRAKLFRDDTARGPKARRVFSGLLRCGSCGGSISSSGKDRHGSIRVQCSASRESGTCDNRRSIRLSEIERVALDGLRKNLMHPVALAEFAEVYNAERKRLARANANDLGKLQRRKGEIDREIERAIDAIVKFGVDPSTLRGRISELEAERATLAEKISAAEQTAPIITLHPAALRAYRDDVIALAEILTPNQSEINSELFMRVRRLVSAITVHAEPNETGFEIEITGRLGELTDMPSFPERSGLGDRVVAREGLEPPTPGL